MKGLAGIAKIALTLLGVGLGFYSTLLAQEIWNGGFIEFKKDSAADWTLEENQDRITDNVWITRKNTRGIFNIKVEAMYDALNGSPEDTEWSYGTTEEIDDLVFEPWANAIDSMVPQMIGQDMVVHLISDDIYIDIKVLEWGITHAGFGYFKYRRATENVPLSIAENESNGLVVFPNPAKDYLKIEGFQLPQSFQILSVSGAFSKSGTYFPNSRIDISDLSTGMYYLILEDKSLVKFIKE